MTGRETEWDEQHTISTNPILPSMMEGHHDVPEAISEFVSQVYANGVSKPLQSMREERRPIRSVVPSIPPIRQVGDNLVIPVVVERMVLVKKYVLLEEIVLIPEEAR